MNLDAARVARDAGIAKVMSVNLTWSDRAMELLRVMREDHREVTGEIVRLWLRNAGLEEPSAPHAWGGLIRGAVKRGLLMDTGRQTQMTAERSHARRTPIWRFA